MAVGDEFHRRGYFHHRGNVSLIERNYRLRKFIERRIHDMSFRALAAECAKKFGSEQSPSPKAIWCFWDRHYRLEKTTCRWPAFWKIDRNPALRRFIHRHIAATTYARLAAMCRERFGDRCVSHNLLNRYWVKRLNRRPPGKSA